MTTDSSYWTAIACAGRAALAMGLLVCGQPGVAGQDSLVTNPQQGATPRPLPTPAPTILPPIAVPPAAPSPITREPLLPIAPLIAPPPRSSVIAAETLPRQSREGGLPAPVSNPLQIDPAADPVLRLARSATPAEPFRAAITEAVRRNPALDEATAQVEEADAIRDEARARALPTIDSSISGFRIFSRAFSNDPGNVLERSRPRQRTDALIRVQQPLIDFGASSARIRAGDARLEAARAGVEDSGTRVALSAVSAWYQVYGFRVLSRLAGAFAAGQRELRIALERRVQQGAAAPADVAQVDGYIAAADAQLADIRRQLASAEATYTATIGAVPAADLGRAPPAALDGITAGSLATTTEQLPAVRAARLGAEAARLDAKATRADLMPQVSAGIDAGRYGLLETDRDYDVRGSLTLSVRLGGGGPQRARQAAARAGGADAFARRTRTDALRDAQIALADVTALEDAEEAIRANYLASRQSRDVLAERFRVARGTLFDLLASESNYFGVATRYVQTVIELDSARYALLARTGRLLPALGIDPTTLEPR